MTIFPDAMKLLKALFISLLVFAAGTVFCQDYKLHKVYIYNFTKYIQWPSEMQSGDFIIGVLGKSTMVEELQAIAASRTVGAQKIVVKEFANASDVDNCHVIFIPTNKSSSLGDLVTKFAGKPTLIITEKSGLGKQGSNINFVLVDGKLKYELNKDAIDKTGLKVSAELTKLAILING